ncbi:MAG: transglutaminase domain-containing protein [Rhodocyclaceae bacterium]|nr:transglutaminase domain-containing protein [Rhodocyclaceae bacterium]
MLEFVLLRGMFREVAETALRQLSHYAVSFVRSLAGLIIRLPHHIIQSLACYFAGRAATTANPFGAYKFLRTVSAAVLVCFTSVTLSPAMAAIRSGRAEQERRANASAGIGALEQYAIDLKRLEAALDGDQFGAAIGARKVELKLTEPRTWFNEAASSHTPTAIAAALTSDATLAAVDAEFAATEVHLKKHNLAPQILKRHAETVAAFRSKHAELKAAASSNSTLHRFLKANQAAAPAKDFKHLAWRSHAAKAREPIVDTAALKQTIETPLTPKAGALKGATHTAKSTSLTQGPDAADLAENADVQLTPGIRAKAAELNHHPVTIYNWVRNNIRFVPSYGSVQGADDTLNKLSGNAFDTASLLIALYRAANIPARYAYGTVELSASEVMNWVGGVANADAAQQLLLQGGIPNVALTSGGQVTKFRIETVWVEAWLNYYPSRGAKHTAYTSLADAQSRGTQWVPMDASFKQMAYTAGMDLKSGVPFDANAFMTAAQQGATVNQSEGWVQNLNQANIQSQLTTYQNQLSAYVNTQKPNGTATVGDVLGTERIIPNNVGTSSTPPTILAGSLPYKVITSVASAPRYATLPDILRHQFQYKLYADAYQRTIDNPTFSYQQSLPSLAGKKVTLSYTPATQADADLIASYLPKPNPNGQPITASQFPTQIPAVAKVKAQLRVEGQVVAEGGNFTLGQELAGQGGFTTYNLTDWDLTNDETLIAGQASAIGLSIQGISAAQVAALQNRLNSFQSVFSSNDLTTLSTKDLPGDMLTAIAWAYHASLDAGRYSTGKQFGVRDYAGLSYGFVHAKLSPVKLLGGITTAAKFSGAEMDVGHLRHIRWSNDNSREKWARYNMARGQLASAMEHATLQKFVGPLDSTEQAVSAVRAIAVAQANGQRIYRVTSANIASVLPQLSHTASIKSDIQNYVAAGRHVTISQAPVAVGSWQGAGMIVVDPETGAGSYLIDGKANGGFYLALFFAVFNVLFAIFVTAFGATPLGVLFAVGPFILLNYVYKNCIAKITPQEDFLISYVELSLTAIAAVVNPLLFVTDLLIELGLYSFSVKALSGPPKDQSFPNCLSPFA